MLQGFVAILFVAARCCCFIATYGISDQLGVMPPPIVKHILNTYGGNIDSHLVYLKRQASVRYPEIGRADGLSIYDL